MRRLAILVLALWLAACASIQKVEGEQVVNHKLAVTVPAVWNKLVDPFDDDPYDTWTQEGLPLDHLRLWAGVRAGQPLMAQPFVFFRAPDEKAPRLPTFKPGMPPDKLVQLFQELYATSGTVRVTRVDATTFAGAKGVRFEFTLARRADELLMNGVGWVAVKDDELYAATFVAPRMTFFSKLLPMAEAVVKTARVRGG